MSSQLAYLEDRFAARQRQAPPGFEFGLGGRFERMVQRHHAKLRRAVAGMLSEPDRVDDVLQEAYLKAYRRLPRGFANEAHEATWLYRVVLRCCLDELRRVRRRQEDPAADLDHVQPGRENPLVRLDVDRAFRRLPVNDRALLLLVELLGVDYESAARILGLKRGTVASRLHAARRRLGAALVAEGVRDAD